MEPAQKRAKTAQGAGRDEKPTSSFVRALLTDMYQVTMAYAYWKAGRHEEEAVFELFFRKNPFHGEFTIFAGLEEVQRFVASFSFEEDDLEWLRSALPPATDPAFFEWLAQIDCSRIKLFAMREGSVVFPRTPLIRVEGPLAVAQLLETTLLNLTNFASLVCTNAQRMRLAAGHDKTLLEFGLRRSQGPDGAMSASRYAYVGGFDGTSNCLAGKLFGISTRGTHAHAFVSSFRGPDDLKCKGLAGREGFWDAVVAKRAELGFLDTNTSELVAFVAYAQAFPEAFLALVDTYDTLVSGVPNFVVVALVLRDFGFKPVGIRLDSGDLSYFSKRAREALAAHGLDDVTIVASNDINEEVLQALSKQGHEIDSFGIGTNLVTCQAQPALGMVFKLVACNGQACIKLSNEFEKTTLPGKKRVFRLVGQGGLALCDLMIREDEAPPTPGDRILCLHPFLERRRCYVRPQRVEELLHLVFDGAIVGESLSSERKRAFVKEQVGMVREDHLRSLNPSVYKVSVSSKLFEFVHELWGREAPIPEIE